jgi:asparagine synthase (glutamine-hydrolysing)
MDYPVAGPGSLPQFQIAREAAKKVKVILGGQGGDEIFGGYARYLIGYLEQCLRAAIEGTQKNGNFIVSLESMIPNLGLLREYKPLLQKFWTDGLFGEMDSRYFQLVNKVSDLGNSVKWEAVNIDKTRESFLGVFNSNRSISKEAYFDSMTHYDFKTLLPALLQVEDRVSMAHGLESRVPFLDHKIVEFAATIPANIKFKNGELKRLIKRTFSKSLPEGITARRDKMGFPVPLSEWSQGPLRNEMTGLLENLRDRQLYFLNGETISHQLGKTGRFSRGIWALINLELWLQQFQDQEKKFAAMPGGYLAGKR